MTAKKVTFNIKDTADNILGADAIVDEYTQADFEKGELDGAEARAAGLELAGGYLSEGATTANQRTGTGEIKIYEKVGEDFNLLETYVYTGAAEQGDYGPGIYKVELWGAQGNRGVQLINNGGRGGYAEGIITLSAEKTLYFYVGGGGNAQDRLGGWNGGGTSASTSFYGGGGGGASDVRIGGQNLTDRTIVAGGGGGSTRYGNNIDLGCGGGLTGGTGHTHSTAGGTGGTQAEGGSLDGGLGVGGSADASKGAGGGGWYGGGAGAADYDAGGGGSSFISAEDYPPHGTRIALPQDLTTLSTDPGLRAGWQADVPAGTSVTVEAAVKGETPYTDENIGTGGGTEDTFYLPAYPAERHSDVVIKVDGTITAEYTRTNTNDPREITFNAGHEPGDTLAVTATYTGVIIPSETAEVQTLYLGGATGGTYELGITGDMKTLDHDANAGAIQTALEEIYGVGRAAVADDTDFTITFAMIVRDSELTADFTGLTGATSPTLTKTTAYDEGDWEEQTSGEEITNVPAGDPTGNHLWVRQTLTTDDPLVTPVLDWLVVWEDDGTNEPYAAARVEFDDKVKKVPATGEVAFEGVEPGTDIPYNVYVMGLNSPHNYPYLTEGDVTVASVDVTENVVVKTLVTMTPSGIPSAEAFGVLGISGDSLKIYPAGIASAEAFGTAAFICGGVVISPSGITSEETFGAAQVKHVVETTSIEPLGIPSAEAFGTAEAIPGPVGVEPSGIATAEAFGTANLKIDQQVTPSGIASAEAFGIAKVTTEADQQVEPLGIASAEAFGTVAVKSSTNPTLTQIAACATPSPPIFSISLNYGNFNSMVIEREETKITQYRFINPETDLTLRTKWRYLTPKLEHNVACGFEVRGILIRYKVRGQKPRVRPED